MSRTEIKAEFLGISSINPFLSNTSSPRGVMDSSHFSQHLPLLNADGKLIKTGIEYELGKTINDVRTDHDYIVKAIIPRYQEYGFDAPVTTILVEYEKDNQLYIDFVDVDTYRTNHNFFGYKLTPTEEFNNLSYNSAIPKGTVLSKADSYGRDGSYDFGLNANVVLMSHPSVSEDGFVISESFAKRSSTLSISKRIINLTKNTIPINLYGDDNNFKFLPELGQKVREDGLLCAIRNKNSWFSISDLNTRNLSDVDIIFDDLTYTNPDSTIIDIKIVRGNYNKSEFTSKMTEQLDRYADMLVNYERNVISKYEQLMNEKKAMYGSNVDQVVRLTPRMHRFITDIYIKLHYVNTNKIKLSYRKLPIDQYRIEITTVNTLVPSLGYKFTDTHA